MSDKLSNLKNPKHLQSEDVYQAAIKAGLTVFTCYSGGALGAFPVVDADGGQLIWPLKSEEAGDWLTHICYEQLKKIPSSQAVKRAQQALAGSARRSRATTREMSEEQAHQALDLYPVGLCILSLLKKKKAFHDSPSVLYDDLTDEAEQCNLRDGTWPKTAAQLTLAINDIKSLLDILGVKAENPRTGSSRFWILRWKTKRTDGKNPDCKKRRDTGDVAGKSTGAQTRSDEGDELLRKRITEILSNTKTGKQLTGEQIRKWRPMKETEICGQEDIKEFFRRGFQAKGRTQHILVTGDSRCGKNTCIEFYIKALACAEVDRGEINPCGKCKPCGEPVAQFGQSGVFSAINNSSLNYNKIDCANTTGEEFKQLLLETSDSNFLTIFHLDEFHRFHRNCADERLLKVMEDRDILFIGNCVQTAKLDQPVLNRFGEKFQVGPVSVEELAVWLAQRCSEWEIATDPATLIAAAELSRGVPGAAIQLLGSAATMDRKLTMGFVKGFRFTHHLGSQK